MTLRDQSDPALRATVHHRTLTLPAEAPSPVRVFERLTRGRAGLLLESSEVENTDASRSLILPAPLLRLRAREEELLVDVLDPRGTPLLPALAGRLRYAEEIEVTGDRLTARVKAAHGKPGQSDRERMLAPSILDAARDLVGLVGDRNDGSSLPIAIYGTFAYELVDRFEELPPRAPDPLAEYDLNLVLGLDGIEIDHERGTALLTTRALDGPGVDEKAEEQGAAERLAKLLASFEAGTNFESGTKARATFEHAELASGADRAPAELSSADYARGVERILEHIAAGDVFQTVLSRSLRVASSAAPLAVYRALRRLNPSPYMFFFDMGDGALLGASPECCVRVDGRKVMLSPIAGTVPRGFGPSGEIDGDLDTRLAASLLLDPKEQAEHAMLVDLARNDLARISVPGTRDVEQPFRIERYSHVQHIVSRVTGELDPSLDALDAYRACANMGTLSGAPKLRAMELIRELEPTARGTYGGALGFLTQDGEFDSCIVIRSLRYKAGHYTVRVGAGVVAASQPEREAMETKHKSQAALRALELAEGGGS